MKSASTTGCVIVCGSVPGSVVGVGDGVGDGDGDGDGVGLGAEEGLTLAEAVAPGAALVLAGLDEQPATLRAAAKTPANTTASRRGPRTRCTAWTLKVVSG